MTASGRGADPRGGGASDRGPYVGGGNAGGDTPGAGRPSKASSPILDLSVRATLGPMELNIELRTGAAAVAVVGPSGAGKTTLLRVVAGVEERAGGVVRFRGEAWLDSGAGIAVPPWRRGVGWVPQEGLLLPHLTVRENLGYGRRPGSDEATGVEDVAEVAGLLEVADLLERRPARLSGGERQRVALGRALLAEPRLLLMDEPFAALDRPLRKLVVERVVEWIRARRIPVLLVSHDERDVDAVAQEVWELHGGRVERASG